MGLDINSVRLLLRARADGVRFTRTATLGRQGMYARKKELRRVVGRILPALDDAQIDRMAREESAYAEPFLKALGAEDVTSIDASSYEGSSILHDMNRPIPDDLKGRFDVVIDGGTLEHVFNFPVAIKNCMEMVAVGGHFLGLTPANNFMGHGFYQFSPELFFRIFTPDNGYAIEQLYLHEDHPGARFYRVSDPQALGCRVDLVNRRPASLYVQARRTADVPVFANTPQQSDYVDYWAKNAGPHARRGGRAFNLGKTYAPEVVKRWVKRAISSKYNRKFFKAVDERPR